MSKIRTIEELIEQYPNKQAYKIKEIHLSDVENNKKYLYDKNKDNHSMIKDYQENGAYLKKKPTKNSFVFFKCTNFKSENVGNNEIFRCDIETIFFKFCGTVKNSISVDRTTNQNVIFDMYIKNTERINKDLWDKVYSHLDEIYPMFCELEPVKEKTNVKYHSEPNMMDTNYVCVYEDLNGTKNLVLQVARTNFEDDDKCYEFVNNLLNNLNNG